MVRLGETRPAGIANYTGPTRSESPLIRSSRASILADYETDIFVRWIARALVRPKPTPS